MLEVAQRLPTLEDKLARLRAAAPSEIVAPDLAALAPIDDVRGTAAYRRDAALTLVRRAVTELVA